jgi:hypothetical protein
MDVADIGPEIWDARCRLEVISSRVYRLKRTFSGFFLRKHLMAISDDINAVTAQLDTLATQAPPAIQAAITAAQASGGDPNAAAAVTALQQAAGNLTTALQGAVPAA